MSELLPLSPAARSMLGGERRAPLGAYIESAKVRVQARLEATLLVAASGEVPAPDGAPEALVRTTAARLQKIALLVGAGGILVGAGFALGRLTAPEAAPHALTTVAAPSSSAPAAWIAPPSSVPSVAPRVEPPQAAQPAEVAPRTIPRAPARTASSVTSDHALATERALVDRARRALQDGRPADALEALREHQKLTSGSGQLGEERDALEVLALASAGRAAEARTAAARFRVRHPSSLFAPSIDDAVASP